MSPDPQTAAPILDPQRLAAVESTGLLDTPPEEALDRLTRLASEILEVPVALVSVVDKDRQYFASQFGLVEPMATKRETPLSHSFCKHVVASSKPLIIADAREHPLVRDNLAIKDLGVIAYLGMPLRTSQGQVLGSFCAVDSKERDWSERAISIMKDLAELVMTEIELRILARRFQSNYLKLRDLEGQRDEMVQMLIHDLRNPLNSLLGGLRLLGADHDQDETRRQLLEIAVRGGESLLEMITTILDVSQAESGKLTLRRGDFYVTDVVAKAVEQVSQLAVTAHVRLSTEFAADLPSLVADEYQLRRVLVNLLSNAIQHTPRGGKVTVSVSINEEGEFLFAVEDDGYGIPEEAFELIFEKFGQAKARRIAGTSTGLGLPFSKMIVEAHGGRIWVESQVGLGTTFRFTIPASPSAV